LARLRTGAAFARYTCWACGRPGLADTQPASVVVEVGEQAARVSLAHARCAPSYVVELRDVAVSAVAEDAIRTWPPRRPCSRTREDPRRC
jgi:hypothetical protein